MELHLRWNDFDNIVTSAFGTPKSDGDLTDVTLNEQTPQDCYKICYVWNTALDSVQGSENCRSGRQHL